MSAPYLTRPEGAWLSAEDWNEIQVQALEDLAGHRHATATLNGESIDPNARIAVAAAETGALRVGGRTIPEMLDDRLGSSPLQQHLQSTVALKGGRVAGSLDVGGDLHVRGNLRVGGQIYLNGRSLSGSAEADGPALKIIELCVDSDTVTWKPQNTGGGVFYNAIMSFELPWAARLLVIERARVREILYPSSPSGQFYIRIGTKEPAVPGDGGELDIVGTGADVRTWSTEVEDRRSFSAPAGRIFLELICTDNLFDARILILAFRE